MKNQNYVKRGDILRVTSGPHSGECYRLCRTLSGRDRDLLGNEVGPVRYVFGLFNVNTGKARVTESDRLYQTTNDGVSFALHLRSLEEHFGLGLRPVTDEPTIAPAVNKAINVEQAKQDVAQALLPLVNAIHKLLPVFDARGTVMGYALAA
jgi:hypothetical protein